MAMTKNQPVNGTVATAQVEMIHSDAIALRGAAASALPSLVSLRPASAKKADSKAAARARLRDLAVLEGARIARREGIGLGAAIERVENAHLEAQAVIDQH